MHLPLHGWSTWKGHRIPTPTVDMSSKLLGGAIFSIYGRLPVASVMYVSMTCMRDQCPDPDASYGDMYRDRGGKPGLFEGGVAVGGSGHICFGIGVVRYVAPIMVTVSHPRWMYSHSLALGSTWYKCVYPSDRAGLRLLS